ncbi:hypothetical protein TSUD_213190 [Trifolium subterraneum]|uniref:Sororin C-terminal region domain-containing protein n=1 Tax=Trifolium subterraneum TaxID=3900 RepID=A0A2Z6MYD0_TRISU|nr:hypothetical protein TSUD_213190 [Trifolium subterraneum]
MVVKLSKEKSDGLERANPPEAKAFSDPCTKKHGARSSKILEEDYIKKQNAYFNLIDEFELVEEDADSMSD